MKKHRPSLTEGEIWALAHVTRHFADYMCGDDRPDHGLGILKQYREGMKEGMFKDKPQYIQDFISAMGKLNRLDRKLRFTKSEK
jgi:hypothetical protein